MNKMLVDRRTAPAVGVMAAAFATVLATVVFFPDQPAPRGALIVPAIIMTAGVLLLPILRALSGSEDTTNAENFVMVGYVFWLLLDLLQGAYDLGQATNDGLRDALTSIGVSAGAVWVGMFGRPWKAPAWLVNVTNQPLEPPTINKLVPICFVLGMVNFAYAVDFDIPVMFSYLGANRFSAPWARGQFGGWGAFLDQMPYFGYVLPALTALLIAKQGLMRPTTFIAIGCSVIMLLFLSQGGGRRLIGVTCGAALLAWIQAHPGLRLKNIVIVGVGAIALAWASQYLLNIRTVGVEVFRERGSEYDYLHIDDNFLRLAQVFELVPEDHPHVGIGMVYFAIVRPIPRVIWPNKPVDSGFDLASAVGLRGVSLSSTIISEWYLGWGWPAIVVGGWIHGRLAKAANTLRETGNASSNPIVYALAVMVLLAGMRSMIELVVMSYALLAWWGVNRLINSRGRAE